MSDQRAPRHAQHIVIFRPSSLHTIMTPAPHAVPVVSFPHYSFAGTAHRISFLFHKAHRVLCLSLLHPWPSRLSMTQGATVYPCYDLSDSISDLVLMPHVSRGGRVTRRKKKSVLIHSAWFIFILACLVFAIIGCCACFMFFLCIIVPDVARCDAGSQKSCHNYTIH